MLPRKFLLPFGAVFCAAIIFFAVVPAHAQTKLYNINVPQSAPPSPPPAAPVSTAVVAPAPAVSAYPTTMPAKSYVALGPSSGWLGQPLGNLNEPSLMGNQTDMLPAASVPPPTIQPPPPKPQSTVIYPNAALLPAMTLATRSGIDFGLQVSGYYYQEHVHPNVFFAEEYGPKVGITLNGTQVFGPQRFFASIDTRFAYGQNRYEGTGTKKDNPDYLGEVRTLGGKDFVFQYFGLATYTGLGYRYLFNDLRGRTDTGVPGYRRDSQYFYAPFGLTPRFRLTDDSRISINGEYDYLIEGWQESLLGDASASEHTVTNEQHTGYGLRASMMYEWSLLSVGPFANYWNINRSATKFTNTPVCSGTGCAEPHNQTIEAGLQFRVHFF